MNYLRKKYLRSQIKEESMKLHFDEVCRQYDQCLALEEKLDNNYKESFSLTYLGIAYEFLILNIKQEAMACLSRIPKSKFISLIHEMKESDIYLAVVLVIYDSIKDELEYKNNYFFQIFEGELLRSKFHFPRNEQLHFPAFLKAWNATFKNLKVIQTIEISKEGKLTKKINFSSNEE